MWIVNIALRRPYTFVVAALLILLSMPYVLTRMPTDIFPRIDIPVVAMLWDYKGMNAKEIADRLAGNVERSMSLIDGIEHSESLSLAGASVIKVFFHPGTDIRTAIAQVMSSSNSVYRSLPTNTSPPQIIQYSAADLPLVQLGISSATVPETEVNDLTNNIVRNVLQAKRGVALTSPYGSKGRQVTLNVDPTSLLARGLAPADLVDAMAEQNLILPTGTLKIGSTEYDVTLNGSIAAIPRLGELPVRTMQGTTTLVKDVANVRDGSTPVTTIARQNGERGIINSIFKVGSVSTLDVVEHVKASIPKMLELMPDGIDMRLMFDQSLFVKAAIGNVLHEALIAASLTAAMILLFLGNWRSTCIIAVSIPLSIMSSLILLFLMGETINLMTMGGLALAVGILVDDATVEIENIERQMLMGKNPHQAILDGAQEIALPAFVSTLCICIVFVPMFFLTGVAHSLFVPMAEAVVFAMLASYVLSRTLVPTLVMYSMSSQHGSHPTRIAQSGRFRRIHHAFESGFERFRDHYVSLLGHLLKHKARFGSLFLGICLLSLGLAPLLGEDLFPAVDAGQIRLHVRAPSGTRIEEMPRLVDAVERVIRERIPADELGDIVDIIGGPYSTRNTLFGNSGTVDAADTEVMISLNPETHGPSESYISELRMELPHRFPGVEFFFQPADQVSQTLNFGIPAPIDIQFVGGKPDQVMPLVVDLNNRLREIPGIVDAHVYQRLNKPALDLEMNRTQLQQLGLSARDVAQNLLLTLSGSMQTAPSYWLNPANGNTVNIGVMGNPLNLDSIDALMRTPVAGSTLKEPQVLGNLVSLKRSLQPAMVTHINANNSFNVYANVAGRDLGSVGREIDALVAETVSLLPKGAEIAVRGQIETLRSSFLGLGTGLAVAILLLYLLLVVNFQSWLDPLIIVSALPAALAGICWTLFLSGTTLSVPALTGAIMAMGVVTANSILLVSFARTRLAEGVPPVTAALEAAATRLRPVLMTAFAMIVGMLPMALGFGEGAEQNAPLGRAVIGGLAFATASTLLFVPLIFAGAHRWLDHRYSTRALSATS
ncbi:efflux RND transporter permease subunit [Methyloterricola oryzae]|uniref:efflux RND transporter permease subunit n=1 Tax=Methyloterricola oryzae TaxID=1495050 RepID=UPI0005EB7827|nr:efflux RND transporter permease subunit [Methyloterricola oryzae]